MWLQVEPIRIHRSHQVHRAPLVRCRRFAPPPRHHRAAVAPLPATAATELSLLAFAAARPRRAPPPRALLAMSAVRKGVVGDRIPGIIPPLSTHLADVRLDRHRAVDTATPELRRPPRLLRERRAERRRAAACESGGWTPASSGARRATVEGGGWRVEGGGWGQARDWIRFSEEGSGGGGGGGDGRMQRHSLTKGRGAR